VRGEIFLSQGKMEAAMESFSEALRLDDRLIDAYRGLGQVSFRSHSHDEALAFFKRALAIDACDSRTILGIGLVYRRLGVLEDALYWLEQAVAQDPSAGAAVAALTQTCNQCSNIQIAIDTLTRLTDSVGDVTALVMTLGHLYIKQGQVETGTELVKKALAS
jgi:tetratricopeptide (TPR) repeat protein